jgi:xanthine/CO dehydrogenase XdhC/CoxF family maturation factor
VVHSSLPAGLEDQAFNDAASCAGRKTSFQKQYSDGETEVNAFFEFIPPPPAILIAGAGNDAQPLVQVISVLGWASTVVDGRRTHATADRFKGAGTVLVATPGQVLGATAPDEQTFCILMTHNYNYDLAVLKELLPSPCRYIGLLGPKKRSERMLAELAEGGFVPDAAQLAKIYSPVGLDLGAETAEEIAISIIGEIKAVIAGRKGTFLREKETPIHG